MSQLLPARLQPTRRVGEPVCPFCGGALAASFRGQPHRSPRARRLGRAALMAAGATLMGAGACSNNDAIGKKARDLNAAIDWPVVATDAHRPVPMPVYGSPPISLGETGGTLGTGAGWPSGYALGAETDAGNAAATDAAPARDAAQERLIIAIYGAAFAGGRTSDKPQS